MLRLLIWGLVGYAGYRIVKDIMQENTAPALPARLAPKRRPPQKETVAKP